MKPFGSTVLPPSAWMWSNTHAGSVVLLIPMVVAQKLRVPDPDCGMYRSIAIWPAWRAVGPPAGLYVRPLVACSGVPAEYIACSWARVNPGAWLAPVPEVGTRLDAGVA